MLDVAIASIHPRFISAYLEFGVLKAAGERQLMNFQVLNLRDFSVDKHGSIDDLPYGGGDGMVFRPEPLIAALRSLARRPKVILTSPHGRPWRQADAMSYRKSEDPLLFICGRFAGVDQRFIDLYVDDEISLGDFVVSGGELPVLMILDSIARQIPGALGNKQSSSEDSFGAGLNGLLEYPLYTRPECFEGISVPKILLSGDHEEIRKWREHESRERTRSRRPDLFVKE